MTERPGRGLDPRQVSWGGGMLGEDASIFAIAREHRLGIEAAHGKNLEERRRCMAFAQDKTITVGSARIRRVDRKMLKIEGDKDVDAGKAGPEMWRSGTV